MKRLLLFVCAMFVGFANAEPTNTSNDFPLNELMQPDYRYLNSAIYPNTGVYDGDVTANAQYDWDLFSPTAGNYLPANSTTITQCTSGNFCLGATNVHYDSIDQGITSCSTLGDNSYTQSVAGSSLETDCYRNCSGNVTIEHATTITGNDYYGNGTDTCSASACENGYHTDNNACGANVLTIHWANSENPNTTCTYGGSITTPATAPTIPGKTFVGWAMGYDFSTLPTNEQSDLYVAKCVQDDSDSCWRNGAANISCNENIFKNLQQHEYKAKFSFGTVYGQALCSSVQGILVGDGTYTPTNTPNEYSVGRYCWCRATKYTPTNSSIQYRPSPKLGWVYTHDYTQSTTCLFACGAACAYYTGIKEQSRKTIFSHTSFN